MLYRLIIHTQSNKVKNLAELCLGSEDFFQSRVFVRFYVEFII